MKFTVAPESILALLSMAKKLKTPILGGHDGAQKKEQQSV